jgi:nucleotide-binding universal stress UspA family protein
MKLLIAIDGSEQALRATRRAMTLSQECRTPPALTLISVHDDVALRHAQRFVGRAAVDDYLREVSEKDLAESRKVLDKAGLKHDMVIRTGHVAAEIAETGSRGRYDLIVLGSKGRSTL